MSTALSPLLAPMLSSVTMRAVCDDVAYLQHMLDFEAALARAEASTGVIPGSAAAPIGAACKAKSFDLAALAEAATKSGNLAIPLVKALTANVAKIDPGAARYVHWGATSQDVIDTAFMLTLRAGIDALLADIGRAIAGFAALGCSTRCRCRSGSSLRNMPRLSTARMHGCCAFVAKDWRCSSAARRARWQPSATAEWRYQSNWPASSICRCRKRPGTPIATASQMQLRCLPSSRAPAARSPATCRC